MMDVCSVLDVMECTGMYLAATRVLKGFLFHSSMHRDVFASYWNRLVLRLVCAKTQ
jgi:hypothetical protein